MTDEGLQKCEHCNGTVMVRVKVLKQSKMSEGKARFACPNCGETMLIRYYPTGEPYHNCPECGLALMSADLKKKRLDRLDKIMERIEEHFDDYGVMNREDYDHILRRTEVDD